MKGLDGGQLLRRLDMSASAAPRQAATPARQQAPIRAQSTPSGAFYASATPLEDQQEPAMRQVLQEQVRDPGKFHSVLYFDMQHLRLGQLAEATPIPKVLLKVKSHQLLFN